VPAGPCTSAQPTISAQIRDLEKALGVKLFERRGRGLALTETGRLVYRYADEIFSVGRELQDTLKGRTAGSRCGWRWASSMPCPSGSHTTCWSRRSGWPSRSG
jgi:DNA-binding transcriptional LysR family regulator